MGQAFNPKQPILQMTEMKETSQIDEQSGLQHLMMGAALGMRNPRTHEDTWDPDKDMDGVLECLALASFLHRCLERCEEFAASNKP